MLTKLELYNHYFYLFTKMLQDGDYYFVGNDVEDNILLTVALCIGDAIDCYKITHPNYQE